MKTPKEYVEGPQAGENFERALNKIFQSPKKQAGTKPAKATARKKRGKKQG